MEEEKAENGDAGEDGGDEDDEGDDDVEDDDDEDDEEEFAEGDEEFDDEELDDEDDEEYEGEDGEDGEEEPQVKLADIYGVRVSLLYFSHCWARYPQVHIPSSWLAAFRAREALNTLNASPLVMSWC